MPAQTPHLIPARVPYLSHAQWGALAYDLLLDNASTGSSSILDCYGITQHQLDELLENKHFQAVMDEAKNELSKLGDNAKFISRARALTESMLPELFRRAMDPRTETKDVHGIFKTMTSLSMLDPVTNGTKNASADAPDLGRGGSFTLVISGIPGMEHLQTQVAHTLNSGGIAPTPLPANVIDAVQPSTAYTPVPEISDDL